MNIKRLRLYKPDSDYLEFVVGQNHTDAGHIKRIVQSGSARESIFIIYFVGGGKTVVSGFPYVLYKK